MNEFSSVVSEFHIFLQLSPHPLYFCQNFKDGKCYAKLESIYIWKVVSSLLADDGLESLMALRFWFVWRLEHVIHSPF